MKSYCLVFRTRVCICPVQYRNVARRYVDPETSMSIAAAIEPSVELTKEQIDFYDREGYLVVDQVSTPGELQQLRGIYDDLFARRAGRAEGNQFDLAGVDEDGQREKLPQILDASGYAPALRTTLAWVNAGRIMTQLLGHAPDRRRDHAILKPALDGAATPWHQDEAYWSPAHEHRSLSLWLALQDVDESMGCMHFVPGSHRREVLEHRPIGNDPRVHGLELVDGAHDLSGAVSCPLRAGGCTVHSQRTLHYAPPNRSSRARRAWIMVGDMSLKTLAVPRVFPWQEVQCTARAERASRATKGPTQTNGRGTAG